MLFGLDWIGSGRVGLGRVGFVVAGIWRDRDQREEGWIFIGERRKREKEGRIG